jgi:hypothetical protein
MMWLAIALGAWLVAAGCLGAALSRWFRCLRDGR